MLWRLLYRHRHTRLFVKSHTTHIIIHRNFILHPTTPFIARDLTLQQSYGLCCSYLIVILFLAIHDVSAIAISLIYVNGGLESEQGVLLMGRQVAALRLGAEFSVGTTGDRLAGGLQVVGGQLMREDE